MLHGNDTNSSRRPRDIPAMTFSWGPLQSVSSKELQQVDSPHGSCLGIHVSSVSTFSLGIRIVRTMLSLIPSRPTCIYPQHPGLANIY
ncbi:hypothetical protein GRJ2_001551300 [Grus japonensis]|uniref:Uncharacterized protein n=1 Tax=Grus japonensis TaxID=30415 RepID=A0ABC9X0R4_GRUJA